MLQAGNPGTEGLRRAISKQRERPELPQAKPAWSQEQQTLAPPTRLPLCQPRDAVAPSNGPNWAPCHPLGTGTGWHRAFSWPDPGSAFCFCLSRLSWVRRRSQLVTADQAGIQMTPVMTVNMENPPLGFTCDVLESEPFKSSESPSKVPMMHLFSAAWGCGQQSVLMSGQPHRCKVFSPQPSARSLQLTPHTSPHLHPTPPQAHHEAPQGRPAATTQTTPGGAHTPAASADMAPPQLCDLCLCCRPRVWPACP